MTLKTNGLALKNFYADARLWIGRDGQALYWADDVSIAVNGAEIVEDAQIEALHDGDEVQILAGAVYSFEDLAEVASLAEYFRSWEQSQMAPLRRYAR